MRKHADKVQIQEPPIREFEKKSSCLKRTCMVGCGGVALFVAVVVFAVVYAASPHPREIRALPANFPDVPVYDVSSTEHISLISGADRNRLLEQIALVPKVIISPIIVALSGGTAEGTSGWGAFSAVIDRPITDHRDVADLSWIDLQAAPQFIENYYIHPLRKSGYTVVDAGKGRTIRQFTFVKGAVSGLILIRDNTDTPGTDEVRLTVHFPSVE
jgi:hypothetical protein